MIARARSGDDNAAVEHGLRTVERGIVDERLEVAFGRDAVLRALDAADVERIPHQLAEALRRYDQASAAAQSGLRGAGENFLLGVARARQILEGAPHQRCAFGIVYEASARPSRRVQVAERRDERPAAQLQRGFHARFRTVRSHVVVELRECGEHAFHQLAGGRIVDRFGCRPEGDAQRLQVRTQREVVVLLPREAGEVVHNDKVHFAFVFAAIFQQVLKLAAIRGFRALAFFLEPFEDLETFAAAVLFAGSKLCGE